MRRAGKLKDNPEEDKFGYYSMRKFYPGRFVQEDDTLRWPRTIVRYEQTPEAQDLLGWT